MSADVSDRAVLENQNAVSMHQCADAMRNQNDRAVAGALAQRVADACVGLKVNGRKRVVKHQHRRVQHEGARNGDALLLSARQGDAAFAHHGVIAVCKADDGFVDIGDGGAPAHLFKRWVLHGDADVLFNGLGKEKRLLQHHADAAAQMVAVNVAQVDAADGDASAVGRQVIQPV